jgi:putative tributyrin esterase
MRIGLKYPAQFSSIWSHSAAFMIDEHLLPGLIDPATIADAKVTTHVDRLLVKGGPVPTISFDCGVDDQLIEHNRDLHAYMDKVGLAHHYAEHPGAHTWDYWDLHVQSALAQHMKVLVG